MEEERKGILIAHSICPFCLIPSHCSTNSYWIKPFILQLRHMAFSLTYPCVMFICCRIKRGAQLIRLNLLLFQMHCFLSCQSQTVLNMGLNHRYSRGLATSGIWDAGRFTLRCCEDISYARWENGSWAMNLEKDLWCVEICQREAITEVRWSWC